MGFLLSATVVASCGGAPASGSSGSKSLTGRASLTCHLGVTYGGDQGGAGMIFARFSVTASPGRPCLVKGYPSITLLGARRKKLRTHATDVADLLGHRATPALITATRPASFTIAYSSFGEGRYRCMPTARAIQVNLPGRISAVYVPLPRSAADLPFDPCTGRLEISTVASVE
jgi:hypothetical protein